MKRSGKGQGINMNGGGTSTINSWKMLLGAEREPPPLREFKPLVVKSHPRQAEMDAYSAMKSRAP